MSVKNTEDLRIRSISTVTTPAELHQELPLSDSAAALVETTRVGVHQILKGEDDRLLVVVGPCSIHDTNAARDYAGRLKVFRDELADDLLIIMRVYFEKPRTTVGWKGLINDPDLDGSFNINKGLRMARELLLGLNEMGIPAGTEFLDVVTPQYVMDLVSWGAIGARTTESQVHRELASGLSCPVGFKNGTDGTVQIAVDAIRSARHPHVFLALTQDAHSAIFHTAGNEDTHVILRGGKAPNYDEESVKAAAAALVKANLDEGVMIDFSHANSSKKYERQRTVCTNVSEQVSGGKLPIFGVMIESHLRAGRQDVKPGRELVYGQSITDACVDLDMTEIMLGELAAAVRARRSAKAAA